jgi:hypothetical protein
MCEAHTPHRARLALSDIARGPRMPLDARWVVHP